MELRHLYAYVAVAEELHFGRASRRLQLSQPAVSRLVSSLETDVGVQLVRRSPHRVELTPPGEAFLKQARVALAEVEATVHAARDASASTTFRVGHSEWTEELLPPLLRGFRARLPDVSISVCPIELPGQARMLHDGMLDVTLSRTPVRPPTGLTSESVLDEPLVAALSADHPLARQDRVSVSELAQTPFVLFPRHLCPRTYELVLRVCAQAGFVPEVGQEAASLSSVTVLVAAGLGVSLVPASASWRFGSADIAYRALRGRTRCVPLLATWREGGAPDALRCFVETARRLRPGADQGGSPTVAP